MRWDDFRQSQNVEDRRGLGMKTGGLGIGTVIVLALVAWALGIDPRILIGGTELVSGGGSGYEESTSRRPDTGTGAPEDQTGKFVAFVLGETECEIAKPAAAVWWRHTVRNPKSAAYLRIRRN